MQVQPHCTLHGFTGKALHLFHVPVLEILVLAKQAQSQKTLDFARHQRMHGITNQSRIFQYRLSFERNTIICQFRNGARKLPAHTRSVGFSPTRHWDHYYYGEDGEHKRVRRAISWQFAEGRRVPLDWMINWAVFRIWQRRKGWMDPYVVCVQTEWASR